MENNSPRKLAMEYNSPPMQRPEEEKFDLSFQFHASRVPVSGWDKLMVSLISLDTGKAAGKTSKCRIRNGFCQWPDTLVETVKLARNPFSGGYADKRYKLLVQMGSLRVGILGEAIVNLSEFVRDDVPETISLPLRNCSAGTILHMDLKAKEDELATIKRGAMESEADLLRKPDELEQSNELPAGVNDLGTDCLKNEQDNSYVEPQLESVLEPAECHLLLEKIVNLETELTEAVEANNMYKLQLRSVFDQQHNVTMAALQDLGDVDQVRNDLCQYKKKATELERELHDMHERYSLISLQLAEAEAERGELMMTLKNQKITKG